MGLGTWLDNAIAQGASENQLRVALSQAGYPQEHVQASLQYRRDVLSAQHHKRLEYLLVGAGILVALVAIVLWIVA